MRTYFHTLLLKNHGPGWYKAFINKLSPDIRKNWETSRKLDQMDSLAEKERIDLLIDFGSLRQLAFFCKEDYKVKADFGKDVNSLPTRFDDIKNVRDKIAHHATDLSTDDVNSFFIQAKKIAGQIGAQPLVQELELLQEKAFEQTSSPAPPKPATAATPLAPTPALGLQSARPLPWREVLRPHEDVRHGNLNEDQYAADLDSALSNTGRLVYRQPEAFFQKTYVTQGLWTLLRRVLGGLSSSVTDADNRVLSLQTNFGGGKTHALLSLLHAARLGPAAAQIPSLQTPPAGYDALPVLPKPVRVAAFTNNTNNPATGRMVAGQLARTPWGDIALQLGGVQAYEHVRANDERWVSPGSNFTAVLQQCTPCLILIDEFADYTIKAMGLNPQYADQLISFVQDLTTAISQLPGAVAVITLPASNLELAASEAGTRILSGLENRLARMASDLQPVAGDEVYEVIRRRIFEEPSPQFEAQREATVEAYHQFYLQNSSRLPVEASRTAYRDKLRRAYPFHPELVDTLRDRWGGHSNFQRTRGVLRTLAAITHYLFKERQHNGWLIHASHLAINRIDSLQATLKRIHSETFGAVISSDVSDDPSSNASQCDQEAYTGTDRPTLAIATVLMMNSIAIDGKLNNGLTVNEIRLQVCEPRPSDPPTVTPDAVDGVLGNFIDRAYYLHKVGLKQDEARYFFTAEPNINVLVNKAKQNIKKQDVTAEIIRRLEDAVRLSSGVGFKLLICPPGETPLIEEQRRMTVVIFPPHLSIKNQGNHQYSPNEEAYHKLKYFHENRGSQPRVYKNTIVFLLPDEYQTELDDVLKELLACRYVQAHLGMTLSPDQKTTLEKKIQQELEPVINKRLTICYKYLVKFRSTTQPQDPQATKVLALETTTHNSELTKSIASITTRLKDTEVLVQALGTTTLEGLNMLPTKGKPDDMSLARFYEAFLRYDDKPMITGPDAIHTTLKRLVSDRGSFALARLDNGKIMEYWTKGAALPSQLPIADSNGMVDPDAGRYFIIHNDDVPKPQLDDLAKNISADYNLSSSLPQTQGFTGATANILQVGDKENYDINTTATPTRRIDPVGRLVIEGKLAPEYYQKAFQYIISKLMDHQLTIEIKIEASASDSKVLDRNTKEYKDVIESARQLKLVPTED